MSDNDLLQQIKTLLDGAPAQETVTVSKSELEALRVAAAPPAPATPEIPSAPVPAAAVAAATPAPGELPAGIMTQAEMEAHENQPLPKGWDEQKAQMAEGERYLESFKFHQGIR